MRLINIGKDGSLSLTGHLHSPSIPPYAILSHTWGDEQGEVKLPDLVNGTWREKSGSAKIEFCVAQAQRDGLSYVWVDTCCVNQTSSAELNEAINSMFRWYQYAAKCYVYLVDVDAAPSINSHWRSFAGSRWFTRGWTLQELLAARKVEFFDHNGKYLGNKEQLQSWLATVTDIPEAALAGTPLDQFDIVERIMWASKRLTGREEDAAYALLGVLDVSMTPRYGEEMSMALTRLYCKAFKTKQQCLSQHQKKQLAEIIRTFQNARWGSITEPQCSAFGSQLMIETIAHTEAPSYAYPATRTLQGRTYTRSGVDEPSMTPAVSQSVLPTSPQMTVYSRLDHLRTSTISSQNRNAFFGSCLGAIRGPQAEHQVSDLRWPYSTSYVLAGQRTREAVQASHYAFAQSASTYAPDWYAQQMQGSEAEDSQDSDC